MSFKTVVRFIQYLSLLLVLHLMKYLCSIGFQLDSFLPWKQTKSWSVCVPATTPSRPKLFYSPLFLARTPCHGVLLCPITSPHFKSYSVLANVSSRSAMYCLTKRHAVHFGAYDFPKSHF